MSANNLWFECPATGRQFEYTALTTENTSADFRKWEGCPACGDTHVLERRGEDTELVEVETREGDAKTRRGLFPEELRLRERELR